MCIVHSHTKSPEEPMTPMEIFTRQIFIRQIMAEVEKKNGIVVKNEHNEFELALRFLGNELIAIKMAATNFSGKLIVWSILLLLFSFMLLEVFGLSAYFGI